MNHGYGIDFGTTNSLLAGFSDTDGIFTEARKTESFTHSETGLPHPSVVRYFDQDRPPQVGKEAKEQMFNAGLPGQGLFFKSIKRDLAKYDNKKLNDGSSKETWKIASEIFKHLKTEFYELSDRYKRESPLNEAVVTVPVDFDGIGRLKVSKAMKEAGIKPKAFVHEPFAALIGHHYNFETKLEHLAGKRILVFDWGGGTLDLCLAEISKDGARIYELGNDGISDRAGDDFDEKILDHLVAEFRNENAQDDFEINAKTRQRLLELCEKAKKDLSKTDIVALILPNFYDSRPLDTDLKETTFSGLIDSEIEAAENCINRLLKRTRLDTTQIDEVLLAGGTSYIPAVRSRLETIFGARVKLTRNPSTVIAEGAAIVAYENWKLYNHSDISVKLSDGTDFIILENGTELIPENSKPFTFTCVDSRNQMAHLLFSHRQVAGDEVFLPLSQLSVPTFMEEARYKNLDRIHVEFSITNEGILDCRAKSSSTGAIVERRIHKLTTGLKIH